MLTSFGRYCRQLRISRNEILKDMTDKLDCRLPYLSGLENGREPIPDELVERIITLYALDEQEAGKIRNAAARTAQEVKKHQGQWNGYV